MRNLNPVPCNTIIRIGKYCDEYGTTACGDSPVAFGSRLLFYRNNSEVGQIADYGLQFESIDAVEEWLTLNLRMIKKIKEISK